MKTSKRLLFFITVICLLMACSKSDQSGFDLSGISGANMSKKPITPGQVIVVSPNGNDDTENLEEAFTNAGRGSTVQLTEGTYYVNFMLVSNFEGYLKGAGKGKTIISPLAGLHCQDQAQYDEMIPAKLLRFIGGNVTISDMTFRAEEIEPCANPVWWTYLSAILYFGDYSIDPNLYLRAEVKNVDFEGKLSVDQPTWHPWLSAIMVGNPWQSDVSVPDCHVDLTVTGCNFTEFDVGISYCTLRQGNFKAGDVRAPNNFSNCIYGFLFRDNLNSSIDISYNNVSYLWSATWFQNNFHHKGSKMLFNVNNNKFYPGSIGWPSVIIYDLSNVDNPMQGKITNNLFTLNEGVWGGIESWSSKDLVIMNNKFTGSGKDRGISIDGVDPSKVDILKESLTTNVLIKDNDFSKLNVPLCDIYLGERSMLCKVNGMNNTDNIINLGQKNIINGMTVLP